MNADMYYSPVITLMYRVLYCNVLCPLYFSNHYDGTVELKVIHIFEN